MQWILWHCGFSAAAIKGVKLQKKRRTLSQLPTEEQINLLENLGDLYCQVKAFDKALDCYKEEVCAHHHGPVILFLITCLDAFLANVVTEAFKREGIPPPPPPPTHTHTHKHTRTHKHTHTHIGSTSIEGVTRNGVIRTRLGARKNYTTSLNEGYRTDNKFCSLHWLLPSLVNHQFPLFLPRRVFSPLIRSMAKGWRLKSQLLSLLAVFHHPGQLSRHHSVSPQPPTCNLAQKSLGYLDLTAVFVGGWPTSPNRYSTPSPVNVFHAGREHNSALNEGVGEGRGESGLGGFFQASLLTGIVVLVVTYCKILVSVERSDLPDHQQSAFPRQLKLAKSAGKPPKALSSICVSLAITYSDLKRYDDALQCYQEELRLMDGNYKEVEYPWRISACVTVDHCCPFCQSGKCDQPFLCSGIFLIFA